MVAKLRAKYRETPVRVRATFWFLICSFLQKGISTITTPIFTRLLTTAEYGQYNVFNSWFGILSAVVTLSLYNGMYSQRLIKFSEERAGYASSMQALSLTLCLGWTAVYLLFREFWNDVLGLTTVQFLAMMVMIWTSGVFYLWSGKMRVECRYRCLVLVTVFVSLAKPGLGIFLVLHAEDKVTARILGLVLVELVAYSGMFFHQLRRGKVFFSKKYWCLALTVCIPLLPHYLSGMVLNGADRIMIRDMVSESAAGIYGLAYSISQVMTIFNTALVQTLEPWIYEKIQDKKLDEIPKVMYPALNMIAALNILLIALAPEVVRLFAPAEYYDAIWVIPPVAMSVYFQFSYFISTYFEFYYEETKLIAISTIAAAVLNVSLNYVFIHMFGYMAAGYTTLFCYAAFAVLHYCGMLWVCRRYLNGAKVYDLRVVLGITAAFLGLSFAFLAAYRLPWVRYSLLAVMAVLMLINYRRIIRMVSSIINKNNRHGGTSDERTDG